MSDRDGTTQGTLEDALELMLLVGFMTPGHHRRLADELSKLREIQAAHERYRGALNTWEDEKAERLDVFRPIFEAHRAKFLEEVTAEHDDSPAIQGGALFVLLDESMPTTDIAAPLGQRIRTVPGPDGTEITLETLTCPHQFTDERSRAQLAAYYAHRIRAADERNERNLARWHNGLRSAWELENLGTGRSRTP